MAGTRASATPSSSALRRSGLPSRAPGPSPRRSPARDQEGRALRRIPCFPAPSRGALADANREFHVADGYLGDPFEAVIPDGEESRFGGRRFWLAHGDLVNEADRQYRLWRRISKSRVLWRAFSVLPSGAGVGIGNALEKRLRGTNVRHKSYFPQQGCEAYGRRLVAAGYDRI